MLKEAAQSGAISADFVKTQSKQLPVVPKDPVTGST